jgi:calcineurin-like phosphoesterase family protein
MSDTWIISDTHFGHANVLNFKDDDGNLIRGARFSSMEEMDEYMVDQWNSVVKDGDKVYHLGDVYFGQGHQILHRLKGQKRLILGNHDNGKDQKLLQHFGKVYVWRMFPEFNILLTHVPVHDNSLQTKTKWNVHGHLHQNLINDARYFNVSVEQINYTPIHIEDVVSRLIKLNGSNQTLD